MTTEDLLALDYYDFTKQYNLCNITEKDLPLLDLNIILVKFEPAYFKMSAGKLPSILFLVCY